MAEGKDKRATHWGRDIFLMSPQLRGVWVALTDDRARRRGPSVLYLRSTESVGTYDEVPGRIVCVYPSARPGLSPRPRSSTFGF